MNNYGRSKIYCTPHGIHVEYKMTTTKNSVYTKLHQIYIFDRRQEQRTKWSTNNIRVTIQWNYRYTKSGIYRTTSGCQNVPCKTISSIGITQSLIQEGIWMAIPIGGTWRYKPIRMFIPHVYPTKKWWKSTILVWF